MKTILVPIAVGAMSLAIVANTARGQGCDGPLAYVCESHEAVTIYGFGSAQASVVLPSGCSVSSSYGSVASIGAAVASYQTDSDGPCCPSSDGDSGMDL